MGPAAALVANALQQKKHPRQLHKLPMAPKNHKRKLNCSGWIENFTMHIIWSTSDMIKNIP